MAAGLFASTVVADLESQVVAVPDAHPRVPGVRVLERVRQRLLDDAERGEVDGRGQGLQRALDLERDVETGRADLVDQAVEACEPRLRLVAGDPRCTTPSTRRRSASAARAALSIARIGCAGERWIELEDVVCGSCLNDDDAQRVRDDVVQLSADARLFLRDRAVATRSPARARAVPPSARSPARTPAASRWRRRGATHATRNTTWKAVLPNSSSPLAIVSAGRDDGDRGEPEAAPRARLRRRLRACTARHRAGAAATGEPSAMIATATAVVAPTAASGAWRRRRSGSVPSVTRSAVATGCGRRVATATVGSQTATAMARSTSCGRRCSQLQIIASR